MTTPANAELTNLVAQHDALLLGQNERLGNVEAKLDSVVSKIDTLASAVLVQQTRPQFDFTKLLTNFKDVGLLVTLVVAGIIYVTTNNFASDLTQFKAKDETFEKQQDALRARISRIEDFFFEGPKNMKERQLPGQQGVQP